MQIKGITGITSTEEAETILVSGYNGTGAEVNRYAPVCWDVTASDGRTFAAPATANIRVPVGVCQDTVGTAEYSHTIMAYGPTTCRTWGVASNFVPGNSLILTNGNDYAAYGTIGQITGVAAGALQAGLACFVALETNATAATAETKVFVRTI